MARRKVQAGPEAKAGWKEEWSWKDAKGVWRKRVIYGTGTAKVWSAQTGPAEDRGDGEHHTRARRRRGHR